MAADDVSDWYSALLPALALCFSPGNVLLLGTAVGTVYLSALRAIHEERSLGRGGSSDAMFTLDGYTAICVPVMGSVCLIIMFFFFASISQLYTLFIAFGAAVALAFAAEPPFLVLWRSLGLYTNTPPDGAVALSQETPRCMGFVRKAPLHTKVLGCLSGALVVLWLLSGHWILNNMLGCSICVFAVSHVRLPNVKVCAILLTSLFVYDVFWVFYSTSVFGSNVMLHVVQQKSSSPIQTALSAMNVTAPAGLARSLDPPVKLLVPTRLPGSRRTVFNVLGLGDIALPGFLLALVACFDQKRCKNDPLVPLGRALPPANGSYLLRATAGYAVGLLVTMVSGAASGAAQPALMYLVPAVLLPVVLTARQHKEFGDVWSGKRPSFCSCCSFKGRTSADEDCGRVQ
mmetsp:Transcript_4753/g.13192  ORF Transcript_4753/g.13192 Transcript_4753/m.13192 type:complete len:402 (+) Transcript_4753:205-1410(+)